MDFSHRPAIQNTCPVTVRVGDLVRVTGNASEFFNMSQLVATTAPNVTVLSSGNPLPTPATIQLPVPGVPAGDLAAAREAINAYFEQFEGMLVTFPATLAVAEYFELARYGQVVLAAGGRPRQFTDQNLPDANGFIDHQIDFARRTIILDDDNNVQNAAITGGDKPYFWPRPGLSVDNFFRGGDTITGLTGILHWSFAGQTGTDAWRIRPVEPDFSYAFTSANPRPAAPAVKGSPKIASFNVLNYFLTIDTTASNSVGDCGPTLTADCRGADSDAELARQREKLTQALLGLDADVIGLIELENTPGVEALAAIVEDLNAAGGDTYDYVDTGVIGTDAIAAAQALADWLATDPTGNGASNILIVGDLNAYRNEDPITVLKYAGYVDLIDQFQGAAAYSYLFGGQLGSLDYALASPSLAARVVDVAEWHINADEVPLFDYNDEIRDPGEAIFERKSNALELYAPDPYRTSDHDPVIVGLDLAPPVLELSVTPEILWPPNHQYVDVMVTATATDNVDPDPRITLVSVTSNEPDNGLGDGNTTNDIVIVDDFHFRLRAERSGRGSGRVYTITYRATDAVGNDATASVAVAAPLNRGGSRVRQ
jgi:predicted extracellular nuclease